MNYNPFDDIVARLERIESLLTQNQPSQDGPMIKAEKPLSTKELCLFLGVSEPTLIKMRKRRRIPFLQIGGLIRYDKNAVVKALEANNKSR